MPYYAVARGRNVGIYSTWDECKANVAGFSNARYKKFSTRAEASEFVKNPSSGATTKVTSGRIAKAVREVSSRTTATYPSNLGKEPIVLPTETESLHRELESLDGEMASLKTKESIYVDGASRGNGKGGIPQSGFGVFYGDNDPRNAAVPLSDCDNVKNVTPTNQRAELHAMNYALQNILKEIKEDRGILETKKWEIFTDSMYTKNCTETWAKKWLTNGWKGSTGKPVANPDIVQALYKAYTRLTEELGAKLKISHVPGHKGIYGNERADQLANLGADRMRID